MHCIHTAEVQASRQTIGAFVYHDLRKSNDVVIILVQGRWSHRPPLMCTRNRAVKGEGMIHSCADCICLGNLLALPKEIGSESDLATKG